MKYILLLSLILTACTVQSPDFETYDNQEDFKVVEPAPTPTPTQTPQILGIDSVGQAINRERKIAGLYPLEHEPLLDKVAKCRSDYLYENDLWTHDGWEDCYNKHYHRAFIGENLAEEYAPGYDYFNAWMNSETHRNNILQPGYRKYGIATTGNITALEFSN